MAKISSMDVYIMNIVKYDTNKRWVIHNFSQEKMCNMQVFEKNVFEEEG
jgi:hypothetical protein